MKIDEKLGIPNDIIDVSNHIYNEILNNIQHISKIDRLLLLGKFDIKILDININQVPFYLKLETTHVLEPELVNLSFDFNYEISLDSKVTSDISNRSFYINMNINEESTIYDIRRNLKGKLKQTYITHELMHFFDSFKSKYNVHDISKSKSYIESYNSFPKVIQNFIYLLYFTSSIENIVKPSELYQSILDNEITKSKFRSFIENTEMMKLLNDGIQFNYNDFKESIKNDQECKNIGDVNKNLYLIYSIISNSTLSEVNHIFNNFIFKIKIDSYIDGDSKDLINNKIMEITKEYMKYDKDIDTFFKIIIQNINENSKTMRLKLYKLFDMVKNDEKYRNKSFNNKVIDWTLHTKINSKNENNILMFRDYWNFFKE